MRHLRNGSVSTLLLCSMLAGCAHLSGPSASEVEIQPIALGALALEAHFLPIGSIDTAYLLKGGPATEVRLPTKQGAVDALLPRTVRLFKFDEETGRWTEVADSRYDEESRELVGVDLGSGVYTAFGWSANPVENALQRILLDSSLGFGGLVNPPDSSPGNEQSSEHFIGEFRRDLLLGWLDLSFSYPVTSCQTRDEPGCPSECRRAAGRVILSSCRINRVVCPQPGCCDCVTGSFTERSVVPRSFFETLPIPCRSPSLGLLCPVCPDGLSCPTGRFVEMPQIKPALDTPDYAFLEDIGLGVVTEDPVLRDDFHDLVEAVTGNKYPVPPPWP